MEKDENVLKPVAVTKDDTMAKNMVAVMMPTTILGTPDCKEIPECGCKTEPAILQAHAVYESEPQVCGKVNI